MLSVRSVNFFTSQVVFHKYTVFGEGIQVDESMIEAIKSWTIPTTITKLCCFHELASFYHGFIEDFSSVMAPMTECVKKRSFKWLLKDPLNQARRGYVLLLFWIYPTLCTFLKLNVMLMGLELVWFSLQL